MEKYLKETKLLDFNDPLITELIKNNDWEELNIYNRIGSIYEYISNDIKFGYNESDEIPASKVLKDGYGQCNTKGILFMALLRKLEIPCRIHGFLIDKTMQKGAMTGFVYKFAPKLILHSWVEIYYENKWIDLEGFILDKDYLKSLQKIFNDCEGNFCGYGIAIDNFKSPPVIWKGESTYIQKDAIVKDLGLYDSPDDLFLNHSQLLSSFKTFFYKNFGRHHMNLNVNRIRKANKARDC